MYLGETPIDRADTPYANMTNVELALEFIMRFGGIDGAHHKDWVLDQVARALHGSPIEDLRVARWTDSEDEYRFNLGASETYLAWVEEKKGEQDEDGEYEYEHNEGISP